jgi:NADPH:quinone reductase-like Zn-dependent oxidoreductase
VEEKAAVTRAVEHVVGLLAQGTVTVPVAARLTMAAAAEAYDLFAAGGKFGKIVLVNPLTNP